MTSPGAGLRELRAETEQHVDDGAHLAELLAAAAAVAGFKAAVDERNDWLHEWNRRAAELGTLPWSSAGAPPENEGVMLGDGNLAHTVEELRLQFVAADLVLAEALGVFAVEVSEQPDRSGIERLQMRAELELVGQPDPVGEQVLAGPHHRAQQHRPRRVRDQRVESDATGAQGVGEHERVKLVAVTANLRRTRPGRPPGSRPSGLPGEEPHLV